MHKLGVIALLLSSITILWCCCCSRVGKQGSQVKAYGMKLQTQLYQVHHFTATTEAEALHKQQAMQLTVTKTLRRAASIFSSPTFRARLAGNRLYVVQPHKRLTVHAPWAVNQSITLPEFAGRHSTYVKLVTFRASVAWRSSQPKLAG
jgi:hypothetical protein